MTYSCRRPQAGFSLIEMIVALVILALSLGALYQAAAGATRNVRIDERHSYAVLIAQSLLADHSTVTSAGVRASGQIEDFRWQIVSTPLPGDDRIPPIQLHQLEAEVAWQDGLQTRRVELITVVPETTGAAAEYE